MNHSPRVVLRAAEAFATGFEAFRTADNVCDAGGLTTYDYSRLQFRNLRRPIWPLDP